MAKPASQWVEDDLLQMKRNETQESLYLEFKASTALGQDERKKDEIGKDVSAFANSEGGDIIYGVAEHEKPPSKFGDIDAGIDPAIISPEWLEQVINSRIQPRIQGILISPIELSRSHPGKYVYVMSVTASQAAPHQAHDKRYYKRFNYQSIAMEDYEVRDVRNRHIEPIVVAEITGKQRQTIKLWDAQNKAELTLSIVLKNIGRRIAQRVYFECDFPAKYLSAPIRIEGNHENSIIDGEHYRNFKYHHGDKSVLLPLFPGTECEILDGNRFYAHLRLMQIDAEHSLDSFIKWKTYADGAAPMIGQISIGNLFGIDQCF